jgi:hypothetical protein
LDSSTVLHVVRVFGDPTVCQILHTVYFLICSEHRVRQSSFIFGSMDFFSLMAGPDLNTSIVSKSSWCSFIFVAYQVTGTALWYLLSRGGLASAHYRYIHPASQQVPMAARHSWRKAERPSHLRALGKEFRRARLCACVSKCRRSTIVIGR